MAEYLNLDQVILLLEARKGEKTLEEFAEEVGISYQFLGHVLRRIRGPGQGILKFLGLRKVTLYVKDKDRR